MPEPGFREDEPQPTQETQVPEQKVEAELSQEIIEKIMAKVQDINEYGTAFSVVSSEYPTPKIETGESKLESIFKYGLLGVSPDQPGVNRAGFSNKTDKHAYVEQIKEKNAPEVFFSIVGRVKENYSGSVASYGYYFRNHGDNVAVMFDLRHYKEAPVSEDDKLDRNTFWPHQNTNTEFTSERMKSFFTNSRGEIVSAVEYGFRLSSRVPPRNFNGAIFQMRGVLSEDALTEKIRVKIEENSYPGQNLDYLKDESFWRTVESVIYEDEKRPEELTGRAKKIATEMMVADKEKLDLLVPIYDIHGNLWWPKQMSYEEVKKLVAEREEKTKEPKQEK